MALNRWFKSRVEPNKFLRYNGVCYGHQDDGLCQKDINKTRSKGKLYQQEE